MRAIWRTHACRSARWPSLSSRSPPRLSRMLQPDICTRSGLPASAVRSAPFRVFSSPEKRQAVIVPSAARPARRPAAFAGPSKRSAPAARQPVSAPVISPHRPPSAAWDARTVIVSSLVQPVSSPRLTPASAPQRAPAASGANVSVPRTKHPSIAPELVPAMTPTRRAAIFGTSVTSVKRTPRTVPLLPPKKPRLPSDDG